MPRADDATLAALLAELDPERLDALDRIWDLCAEELHGLALWRTGSRQDAEDAVQEVFVRLVRSDLGEQAALTAKEQLSHA